MKENIRNPNDEAQLRLENEMKKLNLEMEGAVFGFMSDDMPLDLEKQFLDNIMSRNPKMRRTCHSTNF
jgi:hypothetical protein